MPQYTHTFRCIQCRGQVSYTSKDIEAADVPSLWHGELDELKAKANGKKPSEVSKCSGRLLFASSQLVEIPVRRHEPVDEAWQELETQVKSAWKAFKRSGFQARLRGPNHDRAYIPPLSVLRRLQNAGGSITISGVLYSVQSSNTTNVSLHRQLTESQGAEGTYQSFVFHL